MRKQVEESTAAESARRATRPAAERDRKGRFSARRKRATVLRLLGHDADQAADALHTLTLDVCPVRIGHRVAFARALLTGQAAQEYDPGSKAAAEVERLHTFVMKRVHSITPSQSGVLANG